MFCSLERGPYCDKPLIVTVILVIMIAGSCPGNFNFQGIADGRGWAKFMTILATTSKFNKCGYWRHRDLTLAQKVVRAYGQVSSHDQVALHIEASDDRGRGKPAPAHFISIATKSWYFVRYYYGKYIVCCCCPSTHNSIVLAAIVTASFYTQPDRRLLWIRTF